MSNVAAAARLRRFRDRRKTGAGVIAFVPVTDEVATIEALIAGGFLLENERDNPQAVAKAVGKLLDILSSKESESE